jgi:hypothetical protein
MAGWLRHSKHVSIGAAGSGTELIATRVLRDTYAGLPADVGVVGVANLLVVHQDMPEQLAYDITRLLFEHQPELVAVHAEAARLRPASATTASPAPFHPGAVRYYRERGAWKE